MKIELHEIPVRDLVAGYNDDGESGVTGYNGKLDIRPPYQREFVYQDKQRESVIDTVLKNFPLNVMYWVKTDADSYEILDGQQRTISICQYVNNVFSIDYKYFSNLPDDIKEKILDYKLMVYICEGTDSEKLDWFKTINIAGEKLTHQELRNSVYAGPWLTDAKRHFSRTNGPAYGLASKYLNGRSIRQDYLETALSWINDGDIEGYMAKHQQDPNSDELWMYFRNVIEWVQLKFKKYRKEMKGQPWGVFYNQFKDTHLDATELEERISVLMQDEEINNRKGIYDYVLTGNENKLNLRVFDDKMKRLAYERQDGVCIKCGQKFEYEKMEGDHIIAWSQGGKTNLDNLQMLCKFCNNTKSNA